MKNVLKVSIGRWAFTLSEEAYVLLDNYLDQLKLHYEKEPDTDQKVQDIEDRIGEYLSDCVKSIDQVVDKKQIQQAITTLNLPNFGEHASSEAAGDQTQETAPRRLYRCAERKVLGGVFGGMGEYFGMDPVGLRILYTVFVVIGLFGFHWHINDHTFFRLSSMGSIAIFLIVMYFVMWIVVPLARSPQEKRAMKKPQHSTRKVVHNVGQQSERAYPEPDTASLGRFILGFLRIATSILLIIIGTVGLLVLPVLLLFWDVPVDWLSYLELLPLQPGLIWFKIFALIAVFVPFLFFLYEGIILLFKIRLRRPNLGIVFLFVWILSLFALAISGLYAGRSYWSVGKSQHSSSLSLSSDTLYLDLKADLTSPEQFVYTYQDDMFIYCNKTNLENKFLYVFPKIRLSISDSPEITQGASLRAKNVFIAQMKAEDALDFVEMEGNRLKVHPLYFDKATPWSLEQTSLHLSLPENCVFYVPGKKGQWEELIPNRGYFYPYVGYAGENKGFIIKSLR